MRQYKGCLFSRDSYKDCLSESTAPNDGATAQWNCSLMMQFHVSPESRCDVSFQKCHEVSSVHTMGIYMLYMAYIYMAYIFLRYCLT